jgi:hypothetical protein
VLLNALVLSSRYIILRILVSRFIYHFPISGIHYTMLQRSKAN